MEKLIERGLLFDYYGGLLSEKNKRIYEACAVDDMSLAEIADEMGISRQAVSETLKRIDTKLQGYEKELQLIQKTDSIEKHIGEIRKAISKNDIDRTKIEDILDKIDEAL